VKAQTRVRESCRETPLIGERRVSRLATDPRKSHCTPYRLRTCLQNFISHRHTATVASLSAAHGFAGRSPRLESGTQLAPYMRETHEPTFKGRSNGKAVAEITGFVPNSWSAKLGISIRPRGGRKSGSYHESPNFLDICAVVSADVTLYLLISTGHFAYPSKYHR